MSFTTSTAAVTAQGLYKTFRGKREVHALSGVSFSVPQGTILGLLGPNGAGKTTAVRVLSTIIAPDEGSATVLGHDVVREANTVRHLIGLSGQYATVDENLTGRENLRMVGRLFHLDRSTIEQRAVELLEMFKLTDAANRPLKTYSGGMRRRLDLAASLVSRPPVLFLDEPTTGLDPQSRQDLWSMITRLVREGTTVLLTTQYLEEADQLADSIVVIDRGQVIAEGTPEQLKANLGATVIVLGFADEATAAKAGALLAPSLTRAPMQEGSNIELTVEQGPRVAAESLRTLDGAGIALTGMSLREPSLDDVFLSLTGHRTEEETPTEEQKGRRGRRKNKEAAR
jgi:daunorubicin resistance ABC transporter ATP-binding subunit